MSGTLANERREGARLSAVMAGLERMEDSAAETSRTASRIGWGVVRRA